MIDIYFIEDKIKAIPDEPDEDNYLGSIELDQHKSLEPLWEKCRRKNIHFPFFEDSLLTMGQVREMMEIFNNWPHIIDDKPTSREAYQLFANILSSAIQKSAGLVSYCD